MRTRRWIVVSLVLTAGCASGGGGGGGGEGDAALPVGEIDEAAPPVGEINEDGEFVSESLGYALRPPAGWTLVSTQVDRGVTIVLIASPEGTSGLQVNAGQASADIQERIEAEGEEALEEIAREFAEGNESVDAESCRTIELSSGQSAAVMDLVPEDEVSGGRFLIAVGNDSVYAMTLGLGTDATDIDNTADAVVESFRMLD